MSGYTASWNYFYVHLHVVSDQGQTQSIYLLSQLTEPVSKDKCQMKRKTVNMQLVICFSSVWAD